MLEGLLEPGFELAPDPPIVAEATSGAIYALLYDIDLHRVPGRLAELVRMSTYISLAPFVGAEAAYKVAVGGTEIRETAIREGGGFVRVDASG